MAQYRTTQQCYLRMKGDPTGNAVLIDEGVLIGSDTPYDFEGPPSLGMAPVEGDKDAEAAHATMLEEVTGIPTRLKDEGAMAPQPGGEAPFDPATSDKTSAAEAGAKTDPAKSDSGAKAKAPDTNASPKK